MGWTFGHINRMPWPAASELLASWGKNPPTNELLKAFLEGFGAKVDQKSSQPAPGSLKSAFGDSPGTPGVPGMPGVRTKNIADYPSSVKTFFRNAGNIPKT